MAVLGIRFECPAMEEAMEAEDLVDGDVGDPDEVRAALGGVASGLAEQLTTITQEMNKIREELYGDNGIGGIAQELEKLKSGSLAGLDAGPEPEAAAPGLRSRGSGAEKPTSLEKERRLDELRRKIEQRHLYDDRKKEKVGMLEWLVVIFVIMMMAYTASPSFRTYVKQFLGEMVFGEVAAVEGEVDFGAVVEEDMDSFF